MESRGRPPPKYPKQQRLLYVHENEQSDQLAKTGLSRPAIGPEPVIELSNIEVKSSIKW